MSATAEFLVFPLVLSVKKLACRQILITRLTLSQDVGSGMCGHFGKI